MKASGVGMRFRKPRIRNDYEKLVPILLPQVKSFFAITDVLLRYVDSVLENLTVLLTSFEVVTVDNCEGSSLYELGETSAFAITIRP